LLSILSIREHILSLQQYKSYIREPPTVKKLIRVEWETLLKNYPKLPTGKNELIPILTIKKKVRTVNKVLISKKTI
jgi:hypothetical protein